MRLGKQKKGTVVGLDIEAGSIAATEVQANGSATLTASAIGPLAPGAFHEGEVLDADALAEALKSLFAEHKLSKKVRLGVGNQRVVVRACGCRRSRTRRKLDEAVRSRHRSRFRCRSNRRARAPVWAGGRGRTARNPDDVVVLPPAATDLLLSRANPPCRLERRVADSFRDAPRAADTVPTAMPWQGEGPSARSLRGVATSPTWWNVVGNVSFTRVPSHGSRR